MRSIRGLGASGVDSKLYEAVRVAQVAGFSFVGVFLGAVRCILCAAVRLRFSVVI